MLCNAGCELVAQRRERLLPAAAAQPAQRACEAPLRQARHAHALADARPHLWESKALAHLHMSRGSRKQQIVFMVAAFCRTLKDVLLSFDTFHPQHCQKSQTTHWYCKLLLSQVNPALHAVGLPVWLSLPSSLGWWPGAESQGA